MAHIYILTTQLHAQIKQLSERKEKMPVIFGLHFNYRDRIRSPVLEASEKSGIAYAALHSHHLIFTQVVF